MFQLSEGAPCSDKPLSDNLSILMDVGQCDMAKTKPAALRMVQKMREGELNISDEKVDFLRIWGFSEARSTCYLLTWSGNSYKFKIIKDLDGNVSAVDTPVSRDEGLRLRSAILKLTKDPLPLASEISDVIHTNKSTSIIDGRVAGTRVWAIRKRDWVGDKIYSEYLSVLKLCSDLSLGN